MNVKRFDKNFFRKFKVFCEKSKYCVTTWFKNKFEKKRHGKEIELEQITSCITQEKIFSLMSKCNFLLLFFF